MKEGFETGDYLKAKHARRREEQEQKPQAQQAGPWVWSGMSKGLWEEMRLESSARAISYTTYTVGTDRPAFGGRPAVVLAPLFSGTANVLQDSFPHFIGQV